MVRAGSSTRQWTCRKFSAVGQGQGADAFDRGIVTYTAVAYGSGGGNGVSKVTGAWDGNRNC